MENIAQGPESRAGPWILNLTAGLRYAIYIYGEWHLFRLGLYLFLAEIMVVCFTKMQLT